MVYKYLSINNVLSHVVLSVLSELISQMSSNQKETVSLLFISATSSYPINHHGLDLLYNQITLYVTMHTKHTSQSLNYRNYRYYYSNIITNGIGGDLSHLSSYHITRWDYGSLSVTPELNCTPSVLGVEINTSKYGPLNQQELSPSATQLQEF